jgi:hypothetical protein
MRSTVDADDGFDFDRGNKGSRSVLVGELTQVDTEFKESRMAMVWNWRCT